MLPSMSDGMSCVDPERQPMVLLLDSDGSGDGGSNDGGSPYRHPQSTNERPASSSKPRLFGGGGFGHPGFFLLRLGRLRRISLGGYLSPHVKPSTWAYLVGWFLLNVVITLYSKAVFATFRFPYPALLTCSHMLFTSLGVELVVLLGFHQSQPLNKSLLKIISPFSFLVVLNIWMSNASLLAVPINLHQVVRTTIPVFTMLISYLIWDEKSPKTVILPVLMVVVGVAITVRGQLHVEVIPLVLVLLGCLLSSLKGILTQKTQLGSVNLSALDLLRYLCPMAVVQLILLAGVFGEYTSFRRDGGIRWPLVGHLCLMGIIAFLLNYTSFRVAALISPLTLNIAGNLKQLLVPLLGIWLFGGDFNWSLCIGIFLSAWGAFLYSNEMQKWQADRQQRQEGPLRHHELIRKEYEDEEKQGLSDTPWTLGDQTQSEQTLPSVTLPPLEETHLSDRRGDRP